MTNANLSPQTTTVLFVTFSKWINGKRLPTNGSIEPLRDFLVPKVKKLVIIDQLHPGSHGVMTKIEEYKNGNFKFTPHSSSRLVYWLRPFLEISKSEKTQIRFKIRDFLSVVDWSFRDKTNFDYIIALESINAIAGILLRKLGRVKKVVYYVSDYSPQRYKSKWFNYVYLWLDRFAAVHADYIWDVSLAMQPARISAGLNPKKSAPVIHVPNGLYPAQIKANPITKIDKHALVYMGTVTEDNGSDIAIKALKIVLKKFPGTKLHIIGGTDKDLEWLRNIVNSLKIEKSVIFHGFIPSGIEMSSIIRKCAIGLGPYRDIPGSIRFYADAGKIRNYMAGGLAVISSFVPPLGREVAEKGAAILARDNPKDFAKAIEKIFSDEKLLMKLRKNAIMLARNNTWENSFKNAFELMKNV